MMHISQSQFVILPPSWRVVRPQVFNNIHTDSRRHEELLIEMQRLRGKIYVEDGAIRARDLTSDGRHALQIDDHSWHILTMDQYGKVSGCLRFLEEQTGTSLDDLWISQSALARCPVWGARFRRAVTQEMQKSRSKQVSFGEVGGWAVAEDRRCTIDPLRMVLATCGLFRLLGGCIGLATATVRHGSAAILRRIGLSPLAVDGVEVPSYFDPLYGCQMEALRYDSDFPNPKYAAAINALSAELALAPVICRSKTLALWPDPIRAREIAPPKLRELPALLPVA